MEYIYVLKNKVTGRKYVGRSYCPELRVQKHMSDLRGRRHSNELMQYDFERFGIESFEYEVLEQSEHLTRSCIEGNWILKLQTFNPRNGYNYKDPFVWSRHGYPTKNLRDFS